MRPAYYTITTHISLTHRSIYSKLYLSHAHNLTHQSCLSSWRPEGWWTPRNAALRATSAISEVVTYGDPAIPHFTTSTQPLHVHQLAMTTATDDEHLHPLIFKEDAETYTSTRRTRPKLSWREKRNIAIPIVGLFVAVGFIIANKLNETLPAMNNLATCRSSNTVAIAAPRTSAAPPMNIAND